MSEAEHPPKQDFQVGDIVYHRYSLCLYMITFAELEDTLWSGEKVDFKLWHYDCVILDGISLCCTPFESYQGPETTCPTCRKREMSVENLEVLLRTGLTYEQMKESLNLPVYGPYKSEEESKP